MSKLNKYDQALWVKKVIKSCVTKQQCKSAKKLITNYYNINQSPSSYDIVEYATVIDIYNMLLNEYFEQKKSIILNEITT